VFTEPQKKYIFPEISFTAYLLLTSSSLLCRIGDLLHRLTPRLIERLAFFLRYFVPHLESDEKRDGLYAVVTPVHVVTHKQI